MGNNTTKSKVAFNMEFDSSPIDIVSKKLSKITSHLGGRCYTNSQIEASLMIWNEDGTNCEPVAVLSGRPDDDYRSAGRNARDHKNGQPLTKEAARQQRIAEDNEAIKEVHRRIRVIHQHEEPKELRDSILPNDTDAKRSNGWASYILHSVAHTASSLQRLKDIPKSIAISVEIDADDD